MSPRNTVVEALAEARALGANVEALSANLAMTPAQRLGELVEMNRLHAEIQSRTLGTELRAQLKAREVELARARLPAGSPLRAGGR